MESAKDVLIFLLPLAGILLALWRLFQRWLEDPFFSPHHTTTDSSVLRRLYRLRLAAVTVGVIGVSALWMIVVSGGVWYSRSLTRPPIEGVLGSLMKPLMAGFFATSPVKRGETFEAVLRVTSATIAADQLKAQLETESGQRGVFESGLIRYEPIYIASLTSNLGVPIVLQGETAAKAFTPGDTIEWRWHVTATKGPLKLTATLETPVVVRGVKASVEVYPTFRKTVTVTVTRQQRFQDALDALQTYWPLVLAAFAALAWVYRRWRRRRRPPPPPKSYEAPA